MPYVIWIINYSTFNILSQAVIKKNVRVMINNSKKKLQVKQNLFNLLNLEVEI